MPPKLHNPGLPHQLNLDNEPLLAFSIAGLSTYLLAPRLNCAFDMGDCLLEALPLDHVFITHAHGDHTRCLMRHHALRRMMHMKAATYYVPQASLEGFHALAQAWAKLEQLPQFQPPFFHPLKSGDQVILHRQLMAQTFAVHHTLPSLGYTLLEVRKKLNRAYQGMSAEALANLRRKGVAFETEEHHAKLTFIADCSEETLYELPQLGEAQILFLEVTFLMDDERELAKKRGHLHVEQLANFLKQHPQRLKNRHIVLKHFSMRYSRQQIHQLLCRQLPVDFMKRVHILA